MNEVSTRCRASTSRATGGLRGARAAPANHIEPLVHARSRADHRDPGADGHDGHQGHLRRVRRERLNHGIGFDTAAIELLLPTYAAFGALRARICRHWALNWHPTLIPAIESGFVESVPASDPKSAWKRTSPHARTSSSPAATEHAQQPRDVPDRGPLRLRHVHRLDAADRPRRQQLDGHARRIAGFGGAPNMGADARGAATPAAWLKARARRAGTPDRRAGRSSSCRWSRPSASTCSLRSSRSLDAWGPHGDMGMALPPVMIYGDGRHAHPHRGRHRQPVACAATREREQAIRGVADSRQSDAAATSAVENLRDRRHPPRRIWASTRAHGDATCSPRSRSRSSGGRRSVRPNRPRAIPGTGTPSRAMPRTMMDALISRRASPRRTRRRCGRRRLRQSSCSASGRGQCRVLVHTSARGSATSGMVLEDFSPQVRTSVVRDQRHGRHTGGRVVAIVAGSRPTTNQPGAAITRPPRATACAGSSTPAACASSCRRRSLRRARTSRASACPARSTTA